jgi:hypothetical protein
MYNFGKHAREKARQQKQMEKAEKRMMAKKQKADIKMNTPNPETDIAKPAPAEVITKAGQ